MGKKQALTSIGIASVLALTTVGVGAAQEGGLGVFAESTFRLMSNVFDSSEEVSVEANEKSTGSSDVTVKQDPIPRTYSNGFTEGDVLESSGVPTYSSREFVPSGPDAPKEGEIDPCVISDDYNACLQKSFDDYWESERPEGEGWEEIRIGNAPAMWWNKDLNTLKKHATVDEYLEANMHKYVSGAEQGVTLSPTETRPNGNPSYSIRWQAFMQLSRYDYYHPMNQTLAERAFFRAVFVAEGGERINLFNPDNRKFLSNTQPLNDVRYENWLFQYTFDFLSPCSKGVIESSVILTDGRSFDLNPVPLEVGAPAGLSCDKPSLVSVQMPFGWVYESEDGNLILDSVYLNGGSASIFGANLTGLEKSFISFKAPSTFSFQFKVTEVSPYDNGVTLQFGSQSQKLNSDDYPFGKYTVTLWLLDSEGVIEAFRLPDVEITENWNSADYYFPESARP